MQGKPFNITVIQINSPITDAKEVEFDQFYEDLEDLLELAHTHTHTKKMFYSSLGIGSQEIPGVTDMLGLEEENEAQKRLTEFCQENALILANTPFQQHKR